MAETWTPKTVAVWEYWVRGEYMCAKDTFYGPWHLTRNGEHILTDLDLQTVMKHADALLSQREAKP